MLVSVLAVHLFCVGTPVLAGDVPCKERCNLSHGSCTLTGECKCNPGWEGPNCDQCMKGYGCAHGTCHQPWQCNCLPGWGGRHCNLDLQICERTKPCMNDATCINDGIGGHVCVCKPGFEGIRCERYNPYGLSDVKAQSDPVSATTTPPEPPKLCENDGLCKIYALKGGCEKCICYPGFTGDHCEKTVNDCLTMPCANDGKCFDLQNDFHCECDRGFTGRFCEDDIDECALAPDMCHNGGVCNNTYGSYVCACAPGFTGVRCDDEVYVGKVYVPLITRIVAATEEETTTSGTTTIRAVVKPPVKEAGVIVTKVTRQIAIENADVVISKDSSTIQMMIFLFMGVAILILGAILALVWVRCFRNQGTGHRKDLESPQAPRSKISTVDNKAQTNYQPHTTPIIESATDCIEELDEVTSQQQPCLRQDTPDCPPPPYALSAVDSRRTLRQPYYVSLPSRQSKRPEKRQVLLAAYDVTSRDDPENTSLLEASPTLSHKIVV